VYHGLPDDFYRFHPEPGGYLAFLGRICPEKGVDRAIAIAKRAGIELKIAAKVDAEDEEYFETEIRRLLDDPLVDFIGEIGDGEKEAFLGGAAALLMPIDWPEPFGLVVIEAMPAAPP
jgi:glycosyltransferase involved in cell wall biosynthesis